MKPPVLIQSRDNPFFKDLRRLAAGSRKQTRVWMEGEHLCSALLARVQRPAIAVFAQSFWPEAPVPLTHMADKNVVVADALWGSISNLESPAPMGCVLELPPALSLDTDLPTVVLDRVQDAGNVGSILRSAAAFGFQQIAALQGTALLWSPKVLRAGMGAHFGLRLVQGLQVSDIAALRLPLLATHVHQGEWLHRVQLPWPCGWILGHEGQGIAPDLAALARQTIRICQPGGEESLNVAAAAAICLHASAATKGGH